MTHALDHPCGWEMLWQEAGPQWCKETGLLLTLPQNFISSGRLKVGKSGRNMEIFGVSLAEPVCFSDEQVWVVGPAPTHPQLVLAFLWLLTSLVVKMSDVFNPG